MPNADTRPPARAATRPPIGERELIWMMAMLMALNAFGIDAVLPALDELALELGAAGNDRQFVIGIYLLATGVGALMPGSFADRFGRRPVLFFGLTLYVLLSAACAFVTRFDFLIALRALQGFGAAAIIALPPAIIRDRVGGDKMARMMSLIMVVFLTVPAVAPTIGDSIIALTGSWRWIFGIMALAGIGIATWVYVRLPETLHDADRQDIRPRPIARNMLSAVTMRETVGYTLGSAVVFGSLFGFINSAQQLIGEAFGAADIFPYIFGACASCMALANFSNSRIVERFGARRVSHTALFAFIGTSAVQLVFASLPGEGLWTFVPLMALNMSLLGFIGANFGAIAMQPFRRIAGAASSAQSFLRMVTGALLGGFIGYAYDGTARPLALSLLICAVAALALVFFSERGKLFRRLNQVDDQSAGVTTASTAST